MTTAEPLPRGDIPLIGDPVRDLTIWYSDRVSDANRAALENLRGRFLSPLDPLSDPSTTDLYGTMLLVTIPLLTMGGLALGYLIMTSATSGESAYAARSVTPRFVGGATLAILGHLPRERPRPVRHRPRRRDDRGLAARARGRGPRRLAGRRRGVPGPRRAAASTRGSARAPTTGTTGRGCRSGSWRPCS